VQIVRGDLLPARSTGTFDAQVTVTNRSTDTLLGPLKLALPTGTLAPGASVTTTVRLLTCGQTAGSTVFSLQGARLLAANSAQIVVSAVYAAGVEGPGASSVGAGWEVAVDGVVRGVTDAAGRLALTVQAEARSVAVQRAPSHAGIALLGPLVAGSSASVLVRVDEGKELGGGSLVRLEQAQQGKLARVGKSLVDEHQKTGSNWGAPR
jgi:hypothetical protein